MSYTPTEWKSGDIVSSSKLNKIETELVALDGDVGDLKSAIGQWYYEQYWPSTRYPFIHINSAPTKVYYKLITPTNATGVDIYASNDGFATQTRIYSSTKTEFTAELNTAGYTALRFTAILPAAQTDFTAAAIIHGFDNHSLSQYVYDHKLLLDDLYVPTKKLSGTLYNRFYLTNVANGGIKAIANDNFTITAYPVVSGKTYYLYGKQVKLSNSLVLAAFGTAEVVDGNSYLKALESATTTAANYERRFVAPQNGYIYVAKFGTANGEMFVYDTEYISEEYTKVFGQRLSIKIQLFGDSITDNTWGDKKTWADLVPQNLSEYDVTVVNDAVAGSGIGHGKSTSTSTQHQNDEYNHVYDLVTDGATLQTNADYIVIFAGTNNWASSTALGDMSSTGSATIYGALKGILEYISEHSKATVFVCTIPQRYNSDDAEKTTNSYGEPLDSNGVSLADYCEPFRKVSAFYGMPCVHLNEALGWNRLNIDDFTIDGLHPNDTGDKMLAALICNEIKKHICGIPIE